MSSLVLAKKDLAPQFAQSPLVSHIKVRPQQYTRTARQVGPRIQRNASGALSKSVVASENTQNQVLDSEPAADTQLGLPRLGSEEPPARNLDSSLPATQESNSLGI